MNEDPKKPESVSVDEMMDRLRDRQRSDEDDKGESRETVTRSDGSKVVKVRRRGSRKKSTPSKSESEKGGTFRNKVMLLIIIMLVLIGGGGAFGFYLFQSARLNSPDYAEQIGSELEATTSAKFEFTKFQFHPTSIRANRLTANWPAGNVARDLEVNSIYGELDGMTYILGKPKGESISAKSGKLVLERIPSLGGGNYGSEIPNIFDFKSFRANDFNVYFGSPRDAQIKIEGTRVSLEFEGDSESKVFLKDGSFHSPIFGKMDLKQALVNFHNEHAELNSLVMQKPDSFGKIELSGKILQKDQSKRTLDFNLTDINLSTVTQNRLVTVIKDCRITSNSGSFQLSDTGDYEIKTSGKAYGFDLTALPIMGNLGILVDDNNLAVTHFKEESPVRIFASKDSISVKGLESERRGLFALNVDIEVNNGNQLSGKIQVGLSPRYTDRTSFMAKGAFSRVKGPYKWCDITISGTLDSPKDDSTELFKISALQRNEASKRLLEAEIKRQQARSRRLERARGFDEDGEKIEDEDESKDAGSRFDDLTR